MELQRYEMGDYCSGYVPNDDGEVCMSYDVQRLEESHKELLDIVERITRNNSRTYRFDDSTMATLHCTGKDLNMLTDLINIITSTEKANNHES